MEQLSSQAAANTRTARLATRTDLSAHRAHGVSLPASRASSPRSCPTERSPLVALAKPVEVGCKPPWRGIS
jgi:hypothetical protein